MRIETKKLIYLKCINCGTVEPKRNEKIVKVKVLGNQTVIEIEKRESKKR